MRSHCLPLLLLLLLLLLLTVCGASSNAAAAVSPDHVRVQPQTHALVDGLGRFRLFHGMNVVFKPAPYHPSMGAFDPSDSLCEEDVNNMYQWGFNMVRLYASWEGVEPVKGQRNETYVQVLQDLVSLLWQKKIYTLLDAHQDSFSRKFCGEGVPLWATLNTGAEKFASPIIDDIVYDDATGLPDLTSCLQHPFGEFYFSDAVNKGFQSLYDNQDGIADHFADSWAMVAKAFVGNDAILGYEIINEPWLGDIYSDPMLLLKQGLADSKNLMPLYEKVSAAIRKVDDQHMIFYEPSPATIYPTGFQSGPGGPEYNDRNVFSYHIYCTDVKQNGDPKSQVICDTEDTTFMEIRVNEAKRLGGGAFMTEWGANSNETSGLRQIDALTGYADDYLQSWTYWQFKWYRDYTTQNHPPQGESLYDQDGNLELNKLRKLSRTYAPIIAGRPILMSFNPNTAAFVLEYAIDKTVSQNDSEIYLNEALHYPNGFTISIKPENAASVVQTEKNRLTIKHQNPSDMDGLSVSIHVQRK